MKQILTMLLLWLTSVVIIAQTSRTEICITYEVNVCEPDTASSPNAQKLRDFIAQLRSITSNPRLRLAEITFSGSASPEGSLSANQALAACRREALERIVRASVDLPDSIIRRTDTTTAWSLLEQRLEASDIEGRDEALRLIRTTPEATFDAQGKLVDSRRARLMMLRGGRTWREMLARFFPDLRNACSVALTVEELPALTTQPDVITDSADLRSAVIRTTDDFTASAEPPAPDRAAPRSPRYASFGTNVLYDLLLIPNLGAEAWLGRGYSIKGNWRYAWWKSDTSKRYWRTYGGDLALRRWLGRRARSKPLTGHHLGAYGEMLTFDFELGHKGYLGERWMWGAGLEYGYAMPLARRLNIDFNVSFGYLGGTYKEYVPMDSHYVWQATKRMAYFGPTSIGIDLVWLIGRGNVNPAKKKGGGPL
jgi:hypothetical protein